MSAESKTFTRTPSWRTDKRKTAERGYGGRWQRFRLEYLKRYPLCAYCRKKGKIVEAKVVDHIVPHEGDQTLFWDESNLQSLCVSCHNGIKVQEEGRARKRATGSDDEGWPTFG